MAFVACRTASAFDVRGRAPAVRGRRRRFGGDGGGGAASSASRRAACSASLSSIHRRTPSHNLEPYPNCDGVDATMPSI